MNKWMTVTAAASLMASLVSAADPVHSKNAVGYVKVDVPGSNKLTMVAVPFDSMGVNPFYTLDELIGTNLTANSTATKADEVLMWTGSKYETAFLNDNGWDDPEVNWKWCYLNNEGMPRPCSGLAAYNVEPGDGFWIRNRNQAKTIYLMGEVPTASTTSVSVAGLIMIANPYPVERYLDQLITTNNGAYANGTATKADEILIWTGTRYDTAFLNDDGWDDPAVNWKWCFLNNEGMPEACAGNPIYTIHPGQGFWYRSRGTAFTWDATKPYDYP